MTVVEGLVHNTVLHCCEMSVRKKARPGRRMRPAGKSSRANCGSYEHIQKDAPILDETHTTFRGCRGYRKCGEHRGRTKQTPGRGGDGEPRRARTGAGVHA